jgi:hypothetical protein
LGEPSTALHKNTKPPERERIPHTMIITEQALLLLSGWMEQKSVVRAVLIRDQFTRCTIEGIIDTIVRDTVLLVKGEKASGYGLAC